MVNISTIVPKHMKLKVEKNLPDIMTVVGAGMVVGSFVAACRQTLKAEEVLKKADEDLKKIEYAADISSDEEYTDDDIHNDKIKVYTRTGIELVKIYAVPVSFCVAGLGLMIGSNKILKDRNAALQLAYSNLLATYNAYQAKVAETIGEDKEFALRSGIEKGEVSYLDENDKEKTLKNAKIVSDGMQYSMYARVFDESCANWSRNPTANLTFLRAQQNYANDKLRADGHLFLNDVYQMLGFKKTPEGQIVGWIWDPEDDNIDSYVDFGIYDKIFKSSAKRDFINAYEPCIWLDFNVDGVVYDLI